MQTRCYMVMLLAVFAAIVTMLNAATITTRADDATTGTGTTETTTKASTTKGTTTTEDPRWAIWDEDDRWDMVKGIIMGVAALVALVCVTCTSVCCCLKHRVDFKQVRMKQHTEKMTELKKQKDVETRQARVRGVDNTIVHGYAGGLRDGWNPWNF